MALLSEVIASGLLTDRPAAGTAGRLYYATDGPALYRDNGTTWADLSLSGGMTNPMTTADDVIIGGASGAATRLAKGGNNTVLGVDGSGVLGYKADPSGGGSVGAWHLIGGSGEPAFANGWVNYGGTYQVARYRLEGDVVRVEGLVKSGTTGAAIFTLPAGFRPPADHFFASQGGGQDGSMEVKSTGLVNHVGGTNNYFSVECTFSITA